MKERCKDCGHTKENHTDREISELGSCLYEEESISEDTMFGEQCNCKEFRG